jgi:hypothetical protein
MSKQTTENTILIGIKRVETRSTTDYGDGIIHYAEIITIFSKLAAV